MGCCTQRVSELSKEEKMVIEKEELLGLHLQKSVDIDMAFHRYSISLKLTAPQFTAACRELKITPFNQADQNNPITKFFAKFKLHDGCFNTTKLSALGVLLGKGSISEKARILFKDYDIQISKTLDIKEVQCLINDILDIALSFLPDFALDCEKNPEKHMELMKFNKKLKGVRGSFVKFYEILFIKNEDTDITLAQFTGMFDNPQIEALSSAAKLRSLALKEYSKVIAPVSLVKDYILETSKAK